MFLGDFNIDVNSPDNEDSIQFIEMCDAVDLQQHIKQETHISGNTLNLVLNECVNSEGLWYTNWTVRPQHACNRHLNIQKSSVIGKKVKFQNWKRVSLKPLIEAVENLCLNYDLTLLMILYTV